MWLTSFDRPLPDGPQKDDLGIASYQGRAPLAAACGQCQGLIDDPGRHWFAFAFDFERWELFVSKRVLGEPISLRADDRPTGRCGGLKPGCHVHAVTVASALSAGAFISTIASPVHIPTRTSRSSPG